MLAAARLATYLPASGRRTGVGVSVDSEVTLEKNNSLPLYIFAMGALVPFVVIELFYINVTLSNSNCITSISHSFKCHII